MKSYAEKFVLAVFFENVAVWRVLRVVWAFDSNLGLDAALLGLNSEFVYCTALLYLLPCDDYFYSLAE